MRPINLIFIILLIFSCHLPIEKKLTIRIGVPKEIAHASIWIAKQKNFLKEINLDIVIDSQNNLNSFYKNGKLDLICTTLTEPILYTAEGRDSKIIFRFSYTSGNDVLISNSKIKNIHQLKKKIISFDGVNSSSHIFVEEILRKNQINEGNYYTKNISKNKVLEELLAGKIDAGHTHIRYLSDKKGYFNILAKSSEIPDLVTEVLVGNTNFLNENKKQIKYLLNGLSLANDYIKENPSESAELLENIFLTPKDQIYKELGSIRFLSKEENIQTLNSSFNVMLANENTLV
ncbi:MAG: ABC transporter substrate-binding protein, partial [Leptospira sp.]|nr:ABC transporter substrate-binding protein [Leptospira sp.]